MFYSFCLRTSLRTIKEENYLASVNVGCTLSMQGDILCVGVKVVRQLIINGQKNSTKTVQLEQLCLEHGTCGFDAVLSIKSAQRSSCWVQKAFTTGRQEVFCASCLVGKVTWLPDCLGSCCHWKHTSKDCEDRNVQVMEMEKRLVILACNESMKGSQLQ